MNHYQIRDKSTGQIVPGADYQADSPQPWDQYPFDVYDHELVTYPEAEPKTYSGTDVLIDVGAFFDRFGTSKLDVLTSSNVVVQAIVKDASVRKWIDLTRADTKQALGLISTYVPSVTTSVQATVLALPVQPSENLALRTTYFHNGAA